MSRNADRAQRMIEELRSGARYVTTRAIVDHLLAAGLLAADRPNPAAYVPPRIIEERVLFSEPYGDNPDYWGLTP